MVFPGYVHAQDNAILPRYSIIEPNDNVYTKGLLLAKAVVLSNCPAVPVCVLNLSDKASKLIAVFPLEADSMTLYFYKVGCKSQGQKFKTSNQ